ncbi:MAG: HEAT repeat domain-containing protein [Sedimentisphaerales bacterium]|nr:HEAT repeat domain-containing protein [Sedimentisphaerales bacterium]
MKTFIDTHNRFKVFYIFFVVIILTAANFCQASQIIDDLVPQAQRAVLEGLESSDARLRANAIEVVSTTQKMVFLPKIATFLDDPVMPVRFAAAVALGDTKYKKAEKQLAELLNDTDLNVRIAAAYGLCKMGRMRYLSVIEKAAKVEDQTVVANAAWLLGKLKSEKSLALLYSLKDNKDSSDKVAFNSVEAIARIGDEKIYPRIWTMLISAYAEDRYMGINAMAAFGGSKGANAILSVLDDSVLEIRLAAAQQLGTLGDFSGRIIVLEYLSGASRQEKFVEERCNILAALAIGQIGTEKLIEYLPKLLKNNSLAVRLAAAQSVFILAGAS